MTANRDESVVVACAANRSYALPLAVMLRSAACNLRHGRRLAAFVVDDGIPSEDKARVADSLPDNASVSWITPVRDDFNGLPLWGRMPITTYDKLMVADLLPADCKRAIWLDCDMLVLADIGELWTRPFDGASTLAVQDTLVPVVSSRFGVGRFVELGIDPNAPYFNAGMMVIDVIAWRRDDVARKGLEYLRKFRDSVFFWDQEALNAALAGRWASVEPRWNWSATLDRLSSQSDRTSARAGQARIVHFNGSLKPWLIDDNDGLGIPYFEYLDGTQWAGWRPPRSLRSFLLGWYGSSRVRRQLYPAEHWGVQLLRRLSHRYS
jgi:Lipopolysaccharide biosynthesis proteins, LPS:glycosyltransferases